MAGSKIYTGIGSRAITKYVSYDLVCLGFVMAVRGYKHLAGGAIGSDWSFHMGAIIAQRYLASVGKFVSVGDLTTAIIPWNGFNSLDRSLDWVTTDIDKRAIEIASEFHGGWENLSQAVKKLMSRNVHQVLGLDLQTYSEFVFAFTSDGVDGVQRKTTAKTGGTGQAIRIAASYDVPVRNVGNPEVRARMRQWVADELDKISQQYNTDAVAFIDFQILMDKPVNAKWVKGEIVDLFTTGSFDAVIHVCNCQNKLGNGVAKSLAQAFPKLKEVDAAKGKGRSLLGSFSVLNTEFGSIYNAYGQMYWGRDKDVLYLDYAKLEAALREIHQFTRKKRVLIPVLGAGTANGCWLSIVQILRQFPDWELTIVRG
ncbi:hypothetical protein [Vibrio owensii]|uniref:hypothetical protein n=1 Tax=Vibrio owensii TaxID=696485 RepID=UPI0018F1DF9D|nr:hypothetical protein [Vibrio owensii]